MPYCRNCGTQLTDNARYCYKCGTPTTNTTTNTIHCQNCNTELNNNARYCYKCGTPINTTTIPTPTHIQSPPQTTIQPQNNYYEKPSNESTNDNSLMILTVAILIFTMVALIIAIVAFSPFIDIFNFTPLFEHPGINTVNLFTI